MRDLENIRERENDSEGRPIALVVLLMTVTVGLVFAMGSLVDWTDETASLEEDPLARLDHSAGLVADDSGERSLLPQEVDRTELTFPTSLGLASAERPEVAAALAAAAAELTHPDPLEHLPPMPYARTRAIADSFPAVLPTAVAASPSAEALARTVQTDPLVASSITVPSSENAAEAGEDGPYTIQVISVPSRAEADIFAAGLRTRGHRAFIMVAEVDGRGTWYRVRIGPFATQRAARDYRRDFEAAERMNTLIIRRRDPSPT